MNPLRLFTSFEGRIGRLAFVAGIVLLAAASPFSIGTVISDNPFDEALRAVRRFGLGGLAWSVVLLVGVAALMTKRLHDRGKSGIQALLFYIPVGTAALTYFASHLPLVAKIAYWSTWISWLAGVSGVWFMVSLALYPGQKGPNKFGPPPGNA